MARSAFMDLDNKALEALGAELSDWVDDLERDHQRFFHDIGVWWEWYEARPAVEKKNFPFERASNLVVPIIRVAADNIHSRYFNQIFATESLWVGQTKNDLFAPFVPSVVDWMNWAARHEYDIQTPVHDLIQEMIVIGSGCLWAQWEDRKRTVLLPSNGARQEVTLYRGPRITHIPREQIMWTVGRRLQEAEGVAIQMWMTPHEYLRSPALYGFDEKTVQETCKNVGSDSISGEIRKAKATREGMDWSAHDDEHDIRACWVEHTLLDSASLKRGDEHEAGDDVARYVVHIHRTSRRVLKVTPMPYMTPDWPGVDMYFRRRSGRGSSPGLASMLEHIQRGVTTMVNQSVDACTRANSMWAKTSNPELQHYTFSPDRVIYSPNIGDFELLAPPKQILPDVTLVNLLTGVGERISGVNDPTLGKETRYGGHPSPATTTMALLQESNKLFAMGLMEIRRQLSNLGVVVATLYQQYGLDEGKVVRALGPGDAKKVMEWTFPQSMPLFGNLELDLHAVSQTMNPDAERQKAIVLDQLTSNYYAAVLQLMGVAEHPQSTPSQRLAAIKAIDAKTASYQRFLEASEIDDVERFMLISREARENDSRALGEFGDFARRALEGGGNAAGPAGGGQPVPVGAMGGPEGGPPMGAGPAGPGPDLQQ